MKSWSETVELHDNAVAEYAATADAVLSWNTAPAPGKWTPAEITRHLVLTFEAVLREARGGPPMALRMKAWQRFALRHTILRRMLNGGAFPHGAPAPRETRPMLHRDGAGDADGAGAADGAGTADENAKEAIAEFRRLGAEVIAVLDIVRREQPALRFRHPYFGSMHVSDGLYVSARHIDHHRSQIANR